MIKRKIKTPKQLERYLKGLANHRRIAILDLIANEGAITLEEIAKALNCNIKTISGHTQKLLQAGLIRKKYQGRQVIHTLSPYGERFYEFLQIFSHS
jgi:predicted transcriptional regulator